MFRNKVCIIGSGATCIYILKHLTVSAQPLDITVFESHSESGKGMPYRSDMNAEYMLCNAFSREIPEVTRTLIEWLEELPKRELGEWELSTHELSARAFYPRLLIGEFLADECVGICNLLREMGHIVSIKAHKKVTDIAVNDQDLILVTLEDDLKTHMFDHVVIATGHSWPSTPKIGKANLLSPWPYTRVTQLPPGNIGILGSSLSAIDIVIALGSSHGKFDEHDGTITWQPHQTSQNLKVTMISKMGIMPEGDFYYRYPYEHLHVLTQKAVDAEVTSGPDGLLQRLFSLLCKELDDADSNYLDSLGPTSRTIDGFYEAYFKRRQELGAKNALKVDFAKDRLSIKQKQTIPSRYVLLRAHENFDRALRALDEEDWSHFSKTLLPVFADSYAAVPHLSLARVIAMFDAGVLHLKASGDDAVFTSTENGHVTVDIQTELHDFDVMIDARGQASAPLDDLPFRSLVKNLADGKASLQSPFRLNLKSGLKASIYCLALPQVLERYPFSQGLANSADNGKIVAEHIINTN